MKKEFIAPEFEEMEIEAVAYLDSESNGTVSTPARCTHPNKRTFHFGLIPYGFICDDCGLRNNVAWWDK